MESDFLNYNATSIFNRDAFFINYCEEFFCFEDTYTRLDNISYLISHKTDDQGKLMDLLVPFVVIILRQSIISFDFLTRYNTSNSWLVFRPALEAILFIGKFLDNGDNFALWRDKRDRYKEYKKEFEGPRLAPKSLHHGERFRQLFSKINDEYMHTNYDYIKNNISHRSLDDGRILLGISYTGTSEACIEAHLYSFLHVYHLMVTSLGKILSSRYSDEKALNIDVRSIERWKPKVEKLIQVHPHLKDLCNTLGLWEI